MTDNRHPSRIKLLQATLKVVRTKGYTATRVEDVCAEAGVTKGSFFHHFKSKDELALAAVAFWEEYANGIFADAPYHDHADPLDRLIGYIECRKAMMAGELPEFTCFVGTIVQEAYRTHPDLRDACARNFDGHARALEADIAAAMERHGFRGDWTAESLALHITAVLQGSLILAKAQGGPAPAVQCLEHLRRYIDLLFSGPPDRRADPPSG